MEQYVKEVRLNLKYHNYYSALMVALTLPDICGHIERPYLSTRERYIAWYDQYMLKHYRHFFAGNEIVFLSGGDFYALRCSLLYQGEDNIERQTAREVLRRFQFVQPKPGSYVHNNRIGDRIQLQVDVFCKHIIDGVEAWIEAVGMQGGEIVRIDLGE